MDAQKKRNAFALCLAAFVGANCLSYFVRSDGQNLWEDKIDFEEAIGFPFLVWVGGGSSFMFSRCGLAGNLVIAVLASCVIARKYSEKLPILWKCHPAPMQYSLRFLFAVMTCVAVLLGVAVSDRNLQWGVYNTVRFLAPVALWALLLGLRQASWLRLVAAATGLFVLSVILYVIVDPCFSLSVMLDPFFSRYVAALSAVRAFVPVFGLFSLLVVGHAVVLIIRWKG